MKTYVHIAIVSCALSGALAHAAPFVTGRAVVPPTVVHGVPDEQTDDVGAIPVSDPMEGFNRGMYSFNKGVDNVVFKPAATAYTSVVPSFVRKGVNNLLSYLHTPLDIVNYSLQGNREQAGEAIGRLLVNTFGLGVIDIASDAGISRKQTGFGETFGVWGVPQGPYVVLPLFGGRSLRGTVGTFGDAQLGVVGQLNTNEQATARVLDALDTRSMLLGTEGLIAGAALDEYAFVRDALMQRESNRVEELKE